MGLVIAEPTLDQYLEAGKKIPGLAFDDTLCLILARDHHWTLISTDKALRSACKNANISLLWGLELMLPLVEKNFLSRSHALQTASSIHSLNPQFVNQQILTRFIDKIKKLKVNKSNKNILFKEDIMFNFLNNNSGAISALSTAILALITAVYAYLTRHMAKEATNMEKISIRAKCYSFLSPKRRINKHS